MELAKSYNWLDWVLVLAVLSGFVYGWIRGLIAVLAGFAAYLVSIIVAGRYTPVVVEWIDQTWGLTAKLTELLGNRINLPAEASMVPASAVPWEQVMPSLVTLPLPEEYKVQLAKRVAELSAAGASKSIAEFIIGNLAAGIVSGIVFVLIILVLGYALARIGKLVSGLVSEIPIVGTVNRLLGAVVGLLGSAVSLSILLSLTAPLFGLPMFAAVGDAVAVSAVAQWLISLYGFVSKWLFGQGGSFFFRT